MRLLLDRLYIVALWLSALCLLVIAGLVGLQLAARLIDGGLKFVGLAPTDFVILSLAEMAGYLLAAASFLALAPTLKAGAHIRVTMALSAFGEPTRRLVELGALAVAAAFSAYMTVYIARLTLDSWRFNEISTGLIPVQLAWPQAAMAFGLLVLTIAFVDEFVTVAVTGRPSFRAAEDAITLGKEG